MKAGWKTASANATVVVLKAMKLLIVGHPCAPGLGSEPGLTWNWAWYTARRHQVWVIAHPEYRARVEAYLAEHPDPNLKFRWVDVRSRLDRWTPGQNSEKGIRFHYQLWLKQAYAEAARLHREVGLDLLHHVSWGTVALPPPFWKLPVPALWGPVGGAQYCPPKFLGFFGKGWWKEGLRSLYAVLLPALPSLRRAARSASVVFATNYETAALLRRAGARRVEMFMDNGTSELAAPGRTRSGLGALQLLWAGRIVPQKGLALGLRALAATRNKEARLRIAGDGPQGPEMRQLAASLGLVERVEFLDRLPHEQMTALFGQSDALLFTSLRDSFGSVVLEAVSRGLPIVTIHHQGMRAFVPASASIQVPSSTAARIVRDLADAIDALALDRERLKAMSDAALRFAAEQTWELRAERMEQFYRQVLRGEGGQAAEARR